MSVDRLQQLFSWQAKPTGSHGKPFTPVGLKISPLPFWPGVLLLASACSFVVPLWGERGFEEAVLEQIVLSISRVLGVGRVAVVAARKLKTVPVSPCRLC